MDQGFRQFCKIADIFLKAPDVAPQGASYLEVCKGIRPPEIFKIKHSERLLPVFLHPQDSVPQSIVQSNSL